MKLPARTAHSLRVKSPLSFAQESGYLSLQRRAALKRARKAGKSPCPARPRAVLLKPKVWQQLLSLKCDAREVAGALSSVPLYYAAECWREKCEPR